MLLTVALLLATPASAFVSLARQSPPSSSHLYVETGTVKWFDTKKGFGFITNDSNGQDVFVHQTDIQAEGFRSLQDGASVEFELSEENGKTKAVQVTGPNGEPIPRGFAYKKRDE